MNFSIRVCADGSAVTIPYEVPKGACAADYVKRETLCDPQEALLRISLGLAK